MIIKVLVSEQAQWLCVLSVRISQPLPGVHNSHCYGKKHSVSIAIEIMFAFLFSCVGGIVCYAHMGLLN